LYLQLKKNNKNLRSKCQFQKRNQIKLPPQQRPSFGREAKEEICDNGIDDDGDSLVDVDDLGDCIIQAQEKFNEEESASNDVPYSEP
jgi:hypothetical protein